jgi:hypothetical protein
MCCVIISYMNFRLSVPLNVSAEQAARLQALQAVFAEVCNALAPVVQQTRCCGGLWGQVYQCSILLPHSSPSPPK